jgi:hypothetical protein
MSRGQGLSPTGAFLTGAFLTAGLGVWLSAWRNPAAGFLPEEVTAVMEHRRPADRLCAADRSDGIPSRTRPRG